MEHTARGSDLRAASGAVDLLVIQEVKADEALGHDDRLPTGFAGLVGALAAQTQAGQCNTPMRCLRELLFFPLLRHVREGSSAPFTAENTERHVDGWQAAQVVVRQLSIALQGAPSRNQAHGRYRYLRLGSLCEQRHEMFHTGRFFHAHSQSSAR